MFNAKIHYKWSCSLATLSYQRVPTPGGGIMIFTSPWDQDIAAAWLEPEILSAGSWGKWYVNHEMFTQTMVPIPTYQPWDFHKLVFGICVFLASKQFMFTASRFTEAVCVCAKWPFEASSSQPDRQICIVPGLFVDFSDHENTRGNQLSVHPWFLRDRTNLWSLSSL